VIKNLPDQATQVTSASVDRRAASTRPTAYSTWSLVAVLIGTLALRVASSIMGGTLQLYFGFIDQHIYPLSDTARGFALAVFFLPELVGSPVLGAWSDRMGRKWFLVLGAIFGGVGAQMTAITTNYSALVLMRVLGGLSTASAVPATLSYLSAMSSHSESLRGRVMGLFQIATLAGILGGMLAGGRLWDLYKQTAFSIDAVIYVVSLAVFLFGVHEAEESRAVPLQKSLARGWQAFRRTMHYYREVLFSPTTLRFAPVFLAICMVLGVWLNHTVSQLISPDHAFPNQLLYGVLASDRHAGTDIALYGAVVLAIFGLGVLGWSLVIGRFRRTTVMLIGTGALFVLCSLVFAVNHADSLSDPLIPVYLVLAGMALFVLSGMMPAALTYLADLTEERVQDRGAIMGLYTVLFGFGGFLGTLVGGPFADWRAVDGILVLTVVLGLVAFVLLIRLHRYELRMP
jgi:MFS family permease